MLCFSFCSIYAKHITGGEMIYNFIGPGANNGKLYRITLRLFRDNNCISTGTQACAPLPSSVVLGIYNNDDKSQFGPYRTVNISTEESLPILTAPSCLTNPPIFNYSGGYYTFDIDLPSNAKGYTIAYQTCCRVDGIENTSNSVGATYTTEIPGTDILSAVEIDNSARFQTGISIICYNKPFTLDFSAVDPDAAIGDSLTYYFCDAYNGGGATGSEYPTPAAAPYNSIPYINLYSGGAPLGPFATINPTTGIITGIAPDVGKYVVSVCVQTIRDGRIINVHRKDFIVTVAPCDFAGAQLDPGYLSCDGFTLTFSNRNTSPLNISYYWDFGDGQSSSEIEPTHTYTDTGVYTLKLVVNRGSQCADSTTASVKVFPGYFPAFSSNTPTCKGVPVQFRDQTTATYGVANKWRWDFGDPVTLADTSHVKTPVYTYSQSGRYDVTLIVESNKGCIATVKNTVEIVDKAPFKVTNDTLICSADNLQLTATATNPGSVTWSPNYNINNVNSFTPIVFPKVNITYKVSFQDNFGCSATDSVVVRVVDVVTLASIPDTTICRTDTIKLTTVSDALLYTWTPANVLDNAFAQSPMAIPTAAFTQFHVVGRIGSCTREEDVVIRTVPYPDANAGNDTTICYGFNAALHASGGSSYSWSPAFFLNATSIPNPISQAPLVSLTYVVTVRDNLGCPKPVKDTVLVNVTRIIANAGPKDTSVVLTQPLQLTGTGGTNYQWTPSTWLNNPSIANPIALPLDNIKYALEVSNSLGCVGYDTINVRLFNTKPDLFVPSAFTPNADVLNDVFRPIAVGLKSLESFRVYNRWGQLLYLTSEIGKGWDGRFKGKSQDPGTYVWYAEATDYLGKKLFKKGSVVLIK